MNLIPLPKAAITDADVATALSRAVQIIDPMLDVLWGTDPLGLKERTRHAGDADGALDKAQAAVAWVLNAVDVPGTRAWDEKDLDARINWWVWRVGALDTIAVAFPGVLGAVGDRLPIQDLFGFTSQAVVLCAVAREHGISDHGQQVRLLAAVLCHRDLVAAGRHRRRIGRIHRASQDAHRYRQIAVAPDGSAELDRRRTRQAPPPTTVVPLSRHAACGGRRRRLRR